MNDDGYPDNCVICALPVSRREARWYTVSQYVGPVVDGDKIQTTSVTHKACWARRETA